MVAAWINAETGVGPSIAKVQAVRYVNQFALIYPQRLIKMISNPATVTNSKLVGT